MCLAQGPQHSDAGFVLDKLECHNQKLKKYLNRNMRLPEAVEHLSNFIDDTYAKSSFNQ